MSDDLEPALQRDGTRRWQVAALFGFVGLVGFGLWASFAITNDQAARDLDGWKIRMSLVLESRRAAISAWFLDTQRQAVRLSENTAIQLYATELAELGTATEASAQADYLTNLLVVSFGAWNPQTSTTPVRANLTGSPGPVLPSGAALLSPDGQVLATSAPGLRPPRYVIRALEGKPDGLIPLSPLELDSFELLVPIKGVQAQPGSAPVAYLWARRRLDTDLAARLVQPGQTAESAELSLVRRQQDRLVYLARDGRLLSKMSSNQAMSKMPNASPLAAALAFEAPGRFATDRRDYLARPVLAMGRPVVDPTDDAGLSQALADWAVVHSVQASEALADVRLKRGFLLTLLTLGVCAAGLIALLAWRHGISLRLSEAAREASQARRKSEDAYRFLAQAMDAQPTGVLTLGDKGTVHWANHAARALAGQLGRTQSGSDPADPDTQAQSQALGGRGMLNAFGPDVGMALDALQAEVAQQDKKASRLLRLAGGERARTLKLDAVPLRLEAADTLLVLEDLTELEQAHQRRETSLNSLIAALVRVVDGRDPFAAAHSDRVAQVARELAGVLAVSETEREAAQLVGALMNLGKILVPREMLLRPEALSSDEVGRIRTALSRTSQLLADVPFEGPVLASLDQVLARFDGTGRPEGLSGAQILFPARIAAVANAFVGMISPRAHRPGMALDEALAVLQSAAGTAYDPGVVSALAHVLNNLEGRARWSEFARMPEGSVADGERSED